MPPAQDKRASGCVKPTLQTPPSQRPTLWSAVVHVPLKLAASQASIAVLHRRHGPGQVVELHVTCGVTYVHRALDEACTAQDQIVRFAHVCSMWLTNCCCIYASSYSRTTCLALARLAASGSPGGCTARPREGRRLAYVLAGVAGHAWPFAVGGGVAGDLEGMEKGIEGF